MGLLILLFALLSCWCSEAEPIDQVGDDAVGLGTCERSVLQHGLRTSKSDETAVDFPYDAALVGILQMEAGTGDEEAFKLAKMLDDDEKEGRRVLVDVKANQEVIRRSINEMESSLDVEHAVQKGTLVTSQMLEAISGQDDPVARGEDELHEEEIALVEANRSQRRWIGGKHMKFCFAKNLAEKKKTVFLQAALRIEQQTCLTFEQIEPDANGEQKCTEENAAFVWSDPKNKCSWRWRSKLLSLGDSCEYVGIAIHEIGHAFGMKHEQMRKDRDSYVRILWGNIEINKSHNFKTSNEASTQEPYDVLSIMHYGPNAFGNKSSGSKLQTIESKWDSHQDSLMGQRVGLSRTDIQQLRRWYECDSGGNLAGRLVSTYKGNLLCLDQGDYMGMLGLGVLPCKDSAMSRQKWYWDSDSLKPELYFDLCVEQEEDKVRIRGCNGGNSQAWFWHGHTLRSWNNPHKCLDLSDHGFVNMQPCHWGESQKWGYSGRAGTTIMVPLKGGRNGQFCADEAGQVVCNRNHVKEWEMFSLEHVGPNEIALKGGRALKFCTDDDKKVVCNKDSLGASEKFIWETLGNGYIALKGGRGGKYCSDEAAQIICDRSSIGQWERFKFAV